VQKADLTTRSIACFVDLLIVIALWRLPDVLGFLSACGYILVRDGLFQGRSVGKKLIGLRVAGEEAEAPAPAYRESIIRNTPLAAASILFLIPYAGWVLGPAAGVVEGLVALGDDRGMRIGDMLARTWVVQPIPAPAKTAPVAEPPASDPSPGIGEKGEKQDPLP